MQLCRVISKIKRKIKYMILRKFLQKKIIRLLNSKNILKLFYYYHKFFNNKGLKNIGFDFTNKKNRLFIVQDIIKKKSI